MYAWRPPRAISAASAAAIVAAMGLLFALGLGVERTVSQPLPLVSFALPAPQPTPTSKPAAVHHAHKPAPKNAASPRNRRNQASAVVAPPVKPIVPPPPVVAAPQAGLGAAANSGAATLPGPGLGAGGVGKGNGGGGLGGEGNGDGDGEAVVGPRRTRGDLGYGDLPEGLLAPDQEVTLEVLYTVDPEGRVGACRPTRSSGYAVLDRRACALIEQRYRFRPAKDREGRSVRSQVIENYTWVAHER